MLALAGPACAASASASTSTVYAEPSAGTIARAPVPLSAPAIAAPSARPRGARRRLGVRASQPAGESLAQGIAPTPIAPAAPAPSVNFDGVSSRDSAATNFGAEFEPPDQGLCAGNGFVVEMVNSAYTVYDTHGTTLAGPFNVNAPFDEGLTEFTSDPRCYFDASTNTWFATILAINSEETASTVDVAVNSSGDPRTAWTVYRIDTTALGGEGTPKDPGCPCFGDQPTLGIDAYNLYVTTDEFSIKGPRFNGAQIYALAKKDLVALKPAVHFVHFRKLKIGGALASTVQPALTSGASSAEYFLNALDPEQTSDQRLGVWALSEPQLVAKGGVPTLSSLVIPSERYAPPPPARQQGAAARSTRATTACSRRSSSAAASGAS